MRANPIQTLLQGSQLSLPPWTWDTFVDDTELLGIALETTPLSPAKSATRTRWGVGELRTIFPENPLPSLPKSLPTPGDKLPCQGLTG